MTQPRRWSKDEERKLLELVDADPEDRAKAMGRSVGACAIRLRKIAVTLSKSGSTAQDIESKTGVTIEELQKQVEFENKAACVDPIEKRVAKLEKQVAELVSQKK